MKNFRLLLIASINFALGGSCTGEAAIVTIEQPGVVLNASQPIQAIIVDSSGNTVEQTVYYNPSLGGVDLNASWAGPNASIYFPAYNTGFIWYNGFWVSPEGYYWNGGKRVYVSHPHWGNYWSGYWHGRNHWQGDWHSRQKVNVHVHENVHENVYEKDHHHHH
jgi:hypothetical protein